MTMLTGLIFALFMAHISGTPISDSPNLTVVKGNTLFTKNIYKELSIKEGNVFFSPISAHAVLSLAYQGASGETKDAFTKVLNVPDETAVAEGYNDVLNKLNSVQNVTLLMANKVYLMKKYELQDTFNKAASEKFLSEVEKVDFADKVKTAGVINQWVEEKTHNKITNLVTPDSLSADTRLILVNAIYFKGDWDCKFDKEQTHKKPFYINENDHVEVDMMHQIGEFKYVYDEELEAKILELPYSNKDVSLFVILPKERTGIKKLEQKLLAADLEKTLNQMWTYEVDIHLPKFKIETTINLKDVLSKIGLGVIFDDKADFSKLITGGEALVVSEVLQKAFIEVNEEGAEAAAATVVNTMFRCGKMLPSAEFNADHPYLFSLVHRENGKLNPLFSGKYLIPS